MAEDALARCRALLADLTPLNTDCGLFCGAACCTSVPGEETGMLLFPGEEALAAMEPGWTVRDTEAGRLLICSGCCSRENRPLACRLFPLLPLIRDGGIKVAMDARARAVCPLAADGVQGCRPDFVEAVRQCGKILYDDPDRREFLLALTRSHDALRALQREFGGG